MRVRDFRQRLFGVSLSVVVALSLGFSAVAQAAIEDGGEPAPESAEQIFSDDDVTEEPVSSEQDLVDVDESLDHTGSDPLLDNEPEVLEDPVGPDGPEVAGVEAVEVEESIEDVEILGAVTAGHTRLSGANRFETSVKISQQYPAKVAVAYIVSGYGFADALGASAAAARQGGPVLLTKPGSLPGVVKTELLRLKPKKIVVVGGASAVSNSVLGELSGIAPTERVSGSDRYVTSIATVKNAFTSASHAYLATGRSFPDALAATGAAGAKSAPIILLDGKKKTVSKELVETLKGLKIKSVTVVGGTAVLSEGIVGSLKSNGITVTRASGATRYETAIDINKKAFPKGAKNVLLATGTDFPDALAGGALAGKLKSPLFVTGKKCLEPAMYTAVSNINASKTFLLGGTGALTDNVKSNCNPTKPTPKPTVTAKPTPKPAVTAKPTPKPTVTAKPTPKPTVTAKPTPKPTTTVKPAPTVKPTATAKPTPKPTPKPTVAAKPEISNFWPDLVQSDKPAPIVILGTGLSGTTGVLVDGKTVTPDSVSATRVEFTAPALARGRYDVALQTKGSATMTKASKLLIYVSNTLVVNGGTEISPFLISRSGNHKVHLLADGNMVLYHGNSLIWSSNTSGNGPVTAHMGADGNMFLQNAAGDMVWSTGTQGFPGAYMELRDDGELVLFAQGRAVWTYWDPYRRTKLLPGGVLRDDQYIMSGNHEYRLVMQGDGNLVLYNHANVAMWDSGTRGSGLHLQMQNDGNLVIYQGDTVKWATNTWGKNGAVLVVQDDANVALYHDGVPVWNRYKQNPGPSGGVLGDDYPAWLKNAGQDALVDPWNYYNRECTSFVAWRLNNTNKVGFHNRYLGQAWGNAVEWRGAAIRAGVPVDGNPRVGSVAWSGANTYGHVAWVAAVHSNGTVTIEEYNYKRGVYSNRVVSTGSFQYIHVKDL